MNKILTIVIMADDFAPTLDTLLHQFRLQLVDFGEQVRIIVQLDENAVLAQQVVRPYSFAEVVKGDFNNNLQRRLQAAYSYTDTDYIWAMPSDAKVAVNALATLMPFLSASDKPVVLLHCRRHPLPLPLTENWHFDRFGRAAELSGFFGTYMYPACVVVPGAIAAENWPTYAAAEAQIYAYMRQYRETPVQVVGMPLVIDSGGRPWLEDWQRAQQWARLLCTGLLHNWIDGTDDIESIYRVCEQGEVFMIRGAPTYYALFQWLDHLWKFRWPVSGETLVSAWRVMQQVATDTDYLTPINRIAEMCPGCEGLFHEHMAKQPFWITDLVLRSHKSQGGVVQWAVQPHKSLPENPFSCTLSLPDMPGGELTQQEIGELYSYLRKHEVTFGAVIGTGLGTAAVAAAAGMWKVSQESRCVSITTEEQPDAVKQSATQMASILEISPNALQFLPSVVAYSDLAATITALVEERGKPLEFAFIDGINRSRDYVLATLAAVMPHMIGGGHVFLRNNPYQPLLESDTQEQYGTQFNWVPHCGRPYGYGLSVMRVG